MIPSFKKLAGMLIFVSFAVPFAEADVSLPNIFSDHMVLQQKQSNKIWGKAAAGEVVRVSIADTSVSAMAGDDGMWQAMLPSLDAGGPHELVVRGRNEIKISDVLIGEVWICSGQSNMEWRVADVNDPDLVKVSANYPTIRMINYPNIGSQTPIWTHDDSNWMVCSPENVGSFSAVGYFFGRQVHQAIDVPVGLINDAWGGSAADAWINRDLLESDAEYEKTMQLWQERESRYELLAAKGDLSESEQGELAGLKRLLDGNQRPANIYNGVLKSHLGYGIQGAIWYQGESNASRAYQYRHIFPLMIQNWRDEWGEGDFPFYWVQLADYMAEKELPSESAWAELREAQTMTMSKLPNTGEAVIIDVGEGKDIHPRNKLIVGQRLARWALAKVYGIDIACHSPSFAAMEKKGGKIILSFEHVHGGWRPFDVKEPIGFSIAGPDKAFVWADAKFLDSNQIEVSSVQVQHPVAVRYAWADNPVVNMYDSLGLPLTPFRTDE